MNIVPARSVAVVRKLSDEEKTQKTAALSEGIITATSPAQADFKVGQRVLYTASEGKVSKDGDDYFVKEANIFGVIPEEETK